MPTPLGSLPLLPILIPNDPPHQPPRQQHKRHYRRRAPRAQRGGARVALFLHNPGTMSRSKGVPLTQAGVFGSQREIRLGDLLRHDIEGRGYRVRLGLSLLAPDMWAHQTA